MIKKAILITIILAIIITQQANAETWPVKWKNEYIMQSALGSETVHVNEIITASMAAGLVSSTLAATGNCGTAAAVMGAAEIGILGVLLGTAAYLIVQDLKEPVCTLMAPIIAGQTQIEKQYYYQDPACSPGIGPKIYYSGPDGTNQGGQGCSTVINLTIYATPPWKTWNIGTGVDRTVGKEYGKVHTYDEYGCVMQGAMEMQYVCEDYTLNIVDLAGDNTDWEDQKRMLTDIIAPLTQEQIQDAVNAHPEVFTQTNLNPQISTDPLPLTDPKVVPLPTPTTTTTTHPDPDSTSTTGTTTDPATGQDNTPSTDQDIGTLTTPGYPDAVFDTSMSAPIAKSIPDLISNWMNNAPFVQVFRGATFNASGSCTYQLGTLYGHSFSIDFCKYSGIFAAISAIMISFAYIYAIIIVLIGR